jgi:hypothetical protein
MGRYGPDVPILVILYNILSSGTHVGYGEYSIIAIRKVDISVELKE